LSQPDPQNVSAYLSFEQVLEQFGDLIQDPERLSEGMEVRELLRQMPTRIEAGTEWFFLPKPWLDVWERWCYVDVVTCPLDDASIDIRRVERKNPSKITFSSLFCAHEDNQIMEQQLKFKWQNWQIKDGLREGVDFVFVTKVVLTRLLDNYGSTDSEPLLNFKRVGVEQDDGEVVCEVKLRKINFVAVPNKTRFKMRQPWFFFVPKSDSVAELEKKACRLLNYYLYSILKDKTLILHKCRLWRMPSTLIENVGAADKKFISFTHAEIEAFPIFGNEQQLRLKVDDLNFVDEDLFLLETQKDGKYVFSQKDGNSEESKSQIAA